MRINDKTNSNNKKKKKFSKVNMEKKKNPIVSIYTKNHQLEDRM